MEVIVIEKLRKDETIMTKRFGFTLAEVLITLGIIGVVAAMTIPNLIANTNSAKFRSQFKKTISTMSQAGLMAQAQYDFDYGATDTACGDAGVEPAKQNPETGDTITFCSMLNGTLAGATYIEDVSKLKRASSSDANDVDYTLNKPITLKDLGTYQGYQLADGSLIAFPKTAKACTLRLGQTVADLGDECIGFIDVNGATLPNKEVSCGSSASERKAERSTSTNSCVVKNDAQHMTDVFPVAFHDSTVEPATNASKYVLSSAK